MIRRMKDSGVEWIGEIPADWNIRKIFQVFTQVKNKNQGMAETNLLSLSYGKIKQKNIETSFGLLPESFETYNIIDKNDIVLRLTDLQNDQKSLRVGLSTQRGIITSAYVTMRAKNPRMAPYLYYLLYTFDIEKGFYGMGDGVRQGLNWDELKHLSFVLPELEEQQKIAAFLDEKCGAIDEIIVKTEQSIEEYKKLKQSVITEAVTKGIRPNRRMKDSGIEWIGEIPEDWDVKKFRHILKERTEKNIPIKSTERLSLSIDLGVTLYAEKTTNLDRFKDDFEQYKITHEGDLVMNSMNMIIGAVGVSKYFGCVSPVYYTWYDETQNHTTAKYCEYLLRCKTIKKVLFSLGRGIYAIERGDDRVNTCRLKISRDDLKKLKLPLPSLSEQEEIISYLDKQCVEIDALIEKKQQFLTELATYKKSLIYEYVTGKKEVV